MQSLYSRVPNNRGGGRNNLSGVTFAPTLFNIYCCNPMSNKLGGLHFCLKINKQGAHTIEHTRVLEKLVK